MEGINPKVKQAVPQEHVGILNKNDGSDTLRAFNCYIGQVVTTNYATRMLTVKIDRATINNCVYAPGAAASVLGVTKCQLPAPGAKVLCFYTPLCTYVIGSTPQITKHAEVPCLTSTGLTEYHQSQDFPDDNKRSKEHGKDFAAPGSHMSSDILPVEDEESNDIGIVFRLLANLIQADAGGLALIEQCLANDMVRIVDQYFVHHNCGGDTLIWCNGRCNYEHHFTSYPHEAAGKMSESETFAENVNGPGIYTDKRELDNTEEIVDETGRWRESTYIGFLGDMLHFWITNPSAVVSNYAEGARRAGLLRTWVGADGTLVVQGAGDIMIDATSYMVIPEILHKWDNPEIDSEEIMNNLNGEYLKIWGQGGARWDDLNASVWQMRQYLRYLTIWRSLQRFRQVADASEEKYCKLYPEAESPIGMRDADEIDREGQKGDPPMPYRSVFRVSPDGSQTMIASGKWGISSVILNQGNIQLSAANNIEIKASNDVSIIGKNVSIRAHQALELISLFGHIAQKARTAWKALCEAGRVWLKGDMPEDGDKDPGEDAMEQEWDDYSVVIDASEGKTLIHGNKMVTIGTTDSEADINIEALRGESNVNIYGYDINTVAKHGVYTDASMQWGVKCVTALIQSAVACKIGDNFSVTPLSVDISSITRATHVFTATTFAKGQFIGPDRHNTVYDPDSLTGGEDPEVEHVNTDKIKSVIEDMNVTNVTDDFPSNEFRGRHMFWQLPDWEVPSDFDDPNSLKRDPWTDEYFYSKSTGQGMDGIIEMQWTDSRLMPGTRTDATSFPWPGMGAQINGFTGNMALTTPLDTDFTSGFILSAGDMKTERLVYLFRD